MAEADAQDDAPSGLASPLSLLLQEERKGVGGLQEILLLSFTADLGFFESTVLGVAQATGARATVVGDVTMSQNDPRAVRRAGRSYLAGLARSSGAFHPKLVVLVGPDRATIALGSGNTTLAGWQANAELWTVLRATPDSHPACLPDVVDWLRGLPAEVRLSPGVPQALERVSGLLSNLTASGRPTADSVRLVSSLRAPIVDQLPEGPVDELNVFAPFHDPQAAALRRLVDRLQPRRLTVAYQPALTDLNGPAVAALVEERGGRIVRDDEERYRHGKLVEWTTDGRRWALTGSANISAAALLLSQPQGGNCELGLIAPVPVSLLPAGNDQPVAGLRAVPAMPRPQRQEGPLLLGALRVPEGLEVQLAAPLATAATLELSAAAAPPESWERVAEIPAGAESHTTTVPADAGSRLRLVVSAAGVPQYSNVVFVVDADAVLRRVGLHSPRTPTTQPSDLFEDPRLAERFFSDLQTLRTGLGPGAPTAAAAGSVGHLGAAASLDADDDGWERYLDECAGRVGQPLMRFALGLPVPPGGGAVPFQDLLRVSWDEQLTDDDEAALEDDDAETAEIADEGEPSRPHLPDLEHAPVEVRRRYRRWIERLVEAAAALGPAERMLVVRLTVWTVAAGAWPRTDLTWVPLLARATAVLDRDDLPQRIEPQVGSLAGVALAVLRMHIPRAAVTAHTVAFNKAATAVGHLLPEATAAYVEEYSILLDQAFGTAVQTAAILQVADDLVQADPIAEAVHAIGERGRSVHRHGRTVLHVTGRFGNPAQVALQAVGAAETEPVVGAWATSDSGPWALVAWSRPDLLVVESMGQGTRWRHFRLTGLMGPRALASQGGFVHAAPMRHGPQNRPFPEGVELLRKLGVESSIPPVCP
ncbi:hypothetical protein ACI784_11040 [Geodermatophilus sp. SYSU D01186]